MIQEALTRGISTYVWWPGLCKFLLLQLRWLVIATFYDQIAIQRVLTFVVTWGGSRARNCQSISCMLLENTQDYHQGHLIWYHYALFVMNCHDQLPNRYSHERLVKWHDYPRTDGTLILLMYKEKFLFSPNYWLSAVGLPSLSFGARLLKDCL